MSITPVDVILAIIMGLPIGIIFPVRPRYLYIDFILAFSFFTSFTVVQIIEGKFDGQILGIGVLVGLYFSGVIVGTRFNKRAQRKEAVIKYVEKTGTPVQIVPPGNKTKG